MNALMQEVLSKKTTCNEKIAITVKTLAKPTAVSSKNCTIALERGLVFYTFDGRALFFSKDQKEPTIAIPDEVKQAVIAESEGEPCIFLLSTKNKLECCDFEPTLSRSRYTVTRNVLQIQKSGDKVYFMFKKADTYFVCEGHFDGKRWIGKMATRSISGANVQMHATDGSFYYTIDSRVYDSMGTYLGFSADFIHRHDGMLVIGTKDNECYVLRVLNTRTEHSLMDTFVLDVEDVNVIKIKAHGNFVAIQASSTLNIFRIDSVSMRISLAWCTKCIQEIYQMDFQVDKNAIEFYTLSKSEATDELHSVTESNISSNTSRKIAELNIEKSLEEESGEEEIADIKSSSSTETVCSSEFFYEDNKPNKSSILREMESLSLIPQPLNSSSPVKLKSNLLEEVRAALNKKKSDEEPVSKSEDGLSDEAKADNTATPTESPTKKPQIDRFELFRRNSFADIPNPSKDVSPISKGNSKPSLLSPTKKEPQQSASNFTEISDGAMKKWVDEIKSQNEKILGLLKDIHSREVQAKFSLKEAILENLVPCVEACFNEMRIQIMSEVKKILSASNLGENSKISMIKKLLTNGNSDAAISELLRLSDGEISANLKLFKSHSIENASPSILLEFMTKLNSLAKMSLNEHHSVLIYACLMEMEINSLNIEEIQQLSVLLRSMKDIDGLDSTKYPELSCLIDIMLKKIKKRARTGISSK